MDIVNNFTCICPPGKVIINPYLTNRFSHHYQLDESTFSFRDVRSDFKILFHFSMKLDESTFSFRDVRVLVILKFYSIFR